MSMDQDQEFNLAATIGDTIGVVRRRPWTILIPFVIVFAGMMALAMLLPREYSVKTTMHVEGDTGLEDLYSSVSIKLPSPQSELVTMRQSIVNRRFLDPIIREVGITEGYDIEDPRGFTQLYEEHILSNLSISVQLSDKENGRDFVEIKYVGRDPARIVNFVNRIRQEYVDKYLNRRRQQVRSVKVNLEEQVKNLERQYRERSREYQRFQEEITRETGLGSADLQQVFGRGLLDRKDRLSELARVRQALSERIDRTTEELRKTEEFETTSEERETNPAYALAVSERNEALRLLKIQKDRGARESLPAYKAAEKRVLDAEERLLGLEPFTQSKQTSAINKRFRDLQQRKEDLRTEFQTADRQYSDIDAEVKKMERLAERIPKMESDALTMNRARDEALAALSITRRNSNRAGAAWKRVSSSATRVFIPIATPIEQDVSTSKPVSPQVPLMAGLGAFLGLGLGFGLAFLGEILSGCFVTVGQVRRSLPIPVLGVIGPILDPEEVAAQRRRQWIIGTVIALPIIFLVLAHVAYFAPNLQHYLPVDLFLFMNNLYGGT